MLAQSPLVFFSFGLAALYLAERSLAKGAYAVGLALGLALVAAGIKIVAARIWRARGTPNYEAAALTARGFGLCLLALALYAFTRIFLRGAERVTWREVATVVWPAVMLMGLTRAFASELAFAGMARAPILDASRLRRASRSAAVVAYAIIAFAGLNYAAARFDRSWDLSFLRTTEPSATTARLIAKLIEPVSFVLFMPPGNEVAEQVQGYLEKLARHGEKVQLEMVDQAVAQERARELEVRQNGVLVITRGTLRESLRLGLDLGAARSTLRKLDSEVQARLVKVTRPPRKLYMTQGHMERDTRSIPDDARLPYADFRALAQSLGFVIKPLGLDEGLGDEVPNDAEVVVVAGPVAAFLPGESAAIAAYLERGGRLLLLIDPEHGDTQDELLRPLDLMVSKAKVASERGAVRVKDKGQSPYYFATSDVTSHPSIKTLAQNMRRMAVVMLGAGAIEPLKGAAKPVFTLRAPEGSWRDEDEDGAFDAKRDRRGSQKLVAAIEREASTPDTPPTRAVVISDADVFADGVVRNPGNAYLALDALRWLAGDEDLAASSTSEEDIPLIHKRSDDALWFYGVSFAAPALVLVLGVLARRKTRGDKA